MQPHFTQQPHDPDLEPQVSPRFQLSAILWFPVALVFGAGIIAAASYGHDRATAELASIENPTGANRKTTAEIMIDPGDDPMVLAFERESLENHPAHAPGSEGSNTFIVPDMIRAKVIERDGRIVLIEVRSGKLKGQRLWIRTSRLPEATEQ